MPPKRKARTPPKGKATKQPKKKTPSSFIANSKKELISKLKRATPSIEQEDDLDRLVESVDALIETNGEIWE